MIRPELSGESLWDFHCCCTGALCVSDDAGGLEKTESSFSDGLLPSPAFLFFPLSLKSFKSLLGPCSSSTCSTVGKIGKQVEHVILLIRKLH